MNDILSLTAVETGRAIKEKRLSCVEVVEALLAFIQQNDSRVGAYITVNSDEALTNARKVQQKIQKGEFTSSLAGVPIAIKDNICTKGIKTTCASKMLSGFIPPYDATVITNLQNADAIVLGKLNMDEFAMGSTTETSYFGVTKNPWDYSRVSGGSSGGSAAAVASKEAICSLGSDTGGSVRQPASYCGVTGFKPTYGAVSRYGLIAHASSLDQIGPIAKSVEDCAAIADIICKKDSYDSTSISIEDSFLSCLNSDIKGMKIGIPTEFFEHKGLNHVVAKKVMAMVDTLNALGAQVTEISLPFLEYVIPTYYVISTAEASSNLSRYDGIKYGFRTEFDSTLSDIYKNTRTEGFGEEVKRRILLGTFVLSAGYYDNYYLKALKSRAIIKQGFSKVFETVDAIVCPTVPTTAKKIGMSLDNPLEMYLSDIFTASVNLAGLPAVSVPCGFDTNGLPIGAQIIGDKGKDSKVLRLGFAYQNVTAFHKCSPEVN